jgi:ketosteroid isomerase-like protein
MSQENIDFLRQAVELGDEHDLDSLAARYHPDAELRDLQHLPDIPETLIGREAIIAVWRRWLEALENWTVEVREYIDAEPWVVCDVHWHATGKGSATPIDWRVVEAYEVREAQIVRQIAGFPDVATALKTVGLKE